MLEIRLGPDGCDAGWVHARGLCGSWVCEFTNSRAVAWRVLYFWDAEAGDAKCVMVSSVGDFFFFWCWGVWLGCLWGFGVLPVSGPRTDGFVGMLGWYWLCGGLEGG